MDFQKMVEDMLEWAAGQMNAEGRWRCYRDAEDAALTARGLTEAQREDLLARARAGRASAWAEMAQ